MFIVAVFLLLFPSIVFGEGLIIDLGKDCRIQWDANDPSENVTQYHIEWSTNSNIAGNVQNRETVTGTNISCSDLGIPLNIAGQRWVRAFSENSTGISSPSESLPFEHGEVIDAQLLYVIQGEDLANGKPLNGAVLEQENMNFFFRDASNWEGRIAAIEFTCCTDQKTHTENHTPYEFRNIDLNNYPLGSEQNVTAIVRFNDGTLPATYSAKFSVGTVTQPGLPSAPRLRMTIGVEINVGF